MYIENNINESIYMYYKNYVDTSRMKGTIIVYLQWIDKSAFKSFFSNSCRLRFNQNNAKVRCRPAYPTLSGCLKINLLLLQLISFLQWEITLMNNII